MNVSALKKITLIYLPIHGKIWLKFTHNNLATCKDLQGHKFYQKNDTSTDKRVMSTILKGKTRLTINYHETLSTKQQYTEPTVISF